MTTHQRTRSKSLKPESSIQDDTDLKIDDPIDINTLVECQRVLGGETRLVNRKSRRFWEIWTLLHKSSRTYVVLIHSGENSSDPQSRLTDIQQIHDGNHQTLELKTFSRLSDTNTFITNQQHLKVKEGYGNPGTRRG